MKPNTSFAGVIFGDRLPLPKVAMRVVEMKRFNFDRAFIVSSHPEIFSFLVRGNTEVVASCEEVLARLEGFSGTVVVVNDKSTCRRLDELPLTDGFSEQYEDYKFYIGGSNDHDVATGDAVDTIVASSGHNVNRLPVVVYERFNSEHPPVLPVCFITHNRTAVACHCLDALCRRLKYAGVIRWVICDDRSEVGHVEALENVLRENGIFNYVVKRTNDMSWGLGASMNNGLQEAFSVSDIVLTAEDDFLLMHDFDISEYAKILVNNGIAGIRLAHVSTGANRQGLVNNAVTPASLPGFRRVIGGNKKDLGEHYTFNNQVMLRHKRVYDLLGMYLTNQKAEIVETDMCRKYSIACHDGKDNMYAVMYPLNLPTNTLCNGLFTHIGMSTMGHGHAIPKMYANLNTKEADELARKTILTRLRTTNYRFHIITPHYNCASLLQRCLSSVASQTIDKKKIAMTVIDDASDPEECRNAEMACSSYSFVSFIKSNERINTGGAKNIGLKMGINCDYVVFLDADDVFCDQQGLEKLDIELSETGEPDVMLCGFTFSDTGMSRMFSATSPEGMATSNCIAPWIRVAKKSKTGMFNEKRRIASDVTHYLRQLDAVSTVASSSFPLVKYTKDNPNSAWASKKENFSKDVMRARFLLMSDMLNETFIHDYTKRAAVRQMQYEYNVSLKAVMSHIDEKTF